MVDYSAGMKKKIGLACALLHAPRLLVLDEPFEAVDPVSAALIRDILAAVRRRRRHGRLLQPRDGGRRAAVQPRRDPRRRRRSRASAPSPQVRGDRSLEDVFVEVVGGRTATGSELAWL